MDALKKIGVAHLKAMSEFLEITQLNKLAGEDNLVSRQRAEFVTLCRFYDAVARILEESECEP